MSVGTQPVDVDGLRWSVERLAAAAAVVTPNQLRVSQAAISRLRFGDDGAGFAAWCDQQAPSDAAAGPAADETNA